MEVLILTNLEQPVVQNGFNIIFKGLSLKDEKHTENMDRCKDRLHLGAGVVAETCWG